MRKDEFIEKLCNTLSLSTKGEHGLSHFPCICGDNPLSTDDSEVDEEKATQVLNAVLETLCE